jgi:hypothetical protein
MVSSRLDCFSDQYLVSIVVSISGDLSFTVATTLGFIPTVTAGGMETAIWDLNDSAFAWALNNEQVFPGIGIATLGFASTVVSSFRLMVYEPFPFSYPPCWIEISNKNTSTLVSPFKEFDRFTPTLTRSEGQSETFPQTLAMWNLEE